MSVASKTSNSIEVTAGPGDAGERLDRWLAARIGDISRARIQTLIREGHVSGQGGATIREARTPVKPGVSYAVEVPSARQTEVKGESLPLNIVYEDRSLIVVDKPAGLVVHPAAGHASGTLVNALIAHCGESLSGIGGVKRPGIVHRLDKDTSGLLVVAKTDEAHRGLADQFKSHGRDGRLYRSYLAFVWGRLPRQAGRIETRLGRSRSNRLKIAVVRGEEGRRAATQYQVLESFPDVSLVRLVLETGRTHQIRVHLAHIGHPVLGDPVYGSGFKTRADRLEAKVKGAIEALPGQALHAEALAFEHPRTGKKLSFTSPLPPNLQYLKEALEDRAREAKATEKTLKRRSQ